MVGQLHREVHIKCQVIIRQNRFSRKQSLASGKLVIRIALTRNGRRRGLDMSQREGDELKKLATQASIAIGQENYALALKLAEDIEELPSGSSREMVLSGIWIDAGAALADESVVRRGIELLEKHVREFKNKDKPASDRLTYFYYLGNGYSETAKMMRVANPQYGFFQRTKSDFHKAAQYYRNALQHASRDIGTTATYVNLGNVMDAQSRCLEALECYEKALSISPDFGMALGNKGLGLKYFARISGKHQVVFLSEAHNLLDLACKSHNTLEYAKNDFVREKQEIEEALGDKIVTPPSYQKFKNPGDSQVEKDYVDYGLRHGLYLNACNYCSQRCNEAIEDTFTIETMIVPTSTDLDNDPFLRMQNWMNQIRVAFATARYLLFQATQETTDHEFILKHVLIMETLDYCLFDFGTELLKVAFRSFYSILDQIAWILNEYLKLGIQLNRIYFSDIWYEKKDGERVVRQKILEKESWALNALYDLNFDLSRSDYYKQLRMMRNRLIHRFIYVRDYCKNPSADEMDKRVLEDRTIELAKLVRNAVAYLMFFLWKDARDEEAKMRASGQIIPQMFIDRRK